VWTGLIWLPIERVADCLEHINEPSFSIRCWGKISGVAEQLVAFQGVLRSMGLFMTRNENYYKGVYLCIYGLFDDTVSVSCYIAWNGRKIFLSLLFNDDDSIKTI
jgi:hypothetical protein